MAPISLSCTSLRCTVVRGMPVDRDNALADAARPRVVHLAHLPQDE
jgi:hypothetical protein